jgi:hypothetical protein
MEGNAMSPITERIIQVVFVCCSALAGVSGLAVAAFDSSRPVSLRIWIGILAVLCILTAVHAAIWKKKKKGRR